MLRGDDHLVTVEKRFECCETGNHLSIALVVSKASFTKAVKGTSPDVYCLWTFGIGQSKHVPALARILVSYCLFRLYDTRVAVMESAACYDNALLCPSTSSQATFGAEYSNICSPLFFVFCLHAYIYPCQYSCRILLSTLIRVRSTAL